ncbi:MAG: metal-dependent hydrolase [Calothrix sp. FI2-JRJ7]|jgi:inner membrane protein|nr:metal-dependent hydrolase [Calothrix sp. FI2-JRJ7]
MMGLTHTALSVTGVAMITGSVNPHILLIAAVSSQIPDLDTTKSWIGKVFYVVSSRIEQKFPHRSLTHSIFISFAIALVTIPLLLLNWIDWTLWIAAPVGHLISCFADCGTKLGCQFFYPINRDYWVIGLNPNNRVETGKTSDYAILSTTVLIFCITYYLIAGSGGIGAYVSKTFFPNNQTAIEMLRRENKRAIAVQVEGIKRIDNSRVNEKYWAISVAGSNLVTRAWSSDNIFRVGESGEIIPKKVNLLPDRLDIKTRRQRIEEATAAEWINSLPENALITGTLEIEDVGEVKLPIVPPGVMATITRTGDGVSLEHASRKDLEPLNDYFILKGEVLINNFKDYESALSRNYYNFSTYGAALRTEF